jgi:hypothetical protein
MTMNSGDFYYGPVPEVRTVHEQEKPHPAVVYDADGNALMRRRPMMGFDLNGNKGSE